MATNTAILGLYKKNPLTDGLDNFNIDILLNQNWDKLENEAANVRNTYISKVTTNMYFYVSPTGNDSNDGLTAAAPKKTIQTILNNWEAFKILSNQATGDFSQMTIKLAPGYYNEDIYINGLSGVSKVFLYGAATKADSVNYQIKSISAKLCTTNVYITGINVIGNNGLARIVLDNCKYVSIAECTFAPTNKDTFDGIRNHCTYVLVNNTDISKNGKAIRALGTGVTVLNNCVGNNNDIAYAAETGAIVVVTGGSNITGITKIEQTLGGKVAVSTPNSNLASSGYKIFDDGLIMQWGNIAGTNTTNGIITYPIAFPTAFMQLAITVNRGDAGVTNINTGAGGATSFGWFSNVTLGTGIGFRWIALGY